MSERLRYHRATLDLLGQGPWFAIEALAQIEKVELSGPASDALPLSRGT